MSEENSEEDDDICEGCGKSNIHCECDDPNEDFED